MIRYLSAGDIAGWFGVAAATVTRWRERYPDFPEPDAVIGLDEDGWTMHGWLPEREEEIRRWEEERPGQGWRGRGGAPARRREGA